MARSLWSGAISFGLVNVPVKLFRAVAPKEVRFHMLHAKDGGRIQQQRVCSVDGTEVPWEEIAKGFEIRRGRYVMLTKEELAALAPEESRAIEIVDFVDLAQIDPIHYQQTWYAAPDEGAERPYALLLEAMQRTNKVAIARFVLRTKQHLCAIRPMGPTLALSTMLYADEIVPTKSLELPAKMPRLAARELDMAEQLVESLAGEFDPTKYADEHRERVLALLKKKEEGEEIVAPPSEERRITVINLADALKQSLAARKTKAPRERTGKKPKKRARETAHATRRAGEEERPGLHRRRKR